MFAGTIPMSGVGGAVDVPAALGAVLFEPVAIALRAALVIAAVVMAITLLRLALAAQSGSATGVGRGIPAAGRPQLRAAAAERPSRAAARA